MADWRRETFAWAFAVTALCVRLALLPLPAGAEENPHYGPIECLACHIDEDDYELRGSSITDLCNSCHLKLQPHRSHHPLRPVGPDVTVPEDWPLEDGRLSCLTCHLPSHDEYVGQYMFLRAPFDVKGGSYCSKCHRRESWKGRNPHADANKGEGCNFCHDGSPQPGIDTLETVRLFANPVALCLRCHENDPHPASFSHTVRVAPEMIPKVAREVKLFEGTSVVCSTCHNPHILESGGHKLRDCAKEALSCPGCHRM